MPLPALEALTGRVFRLRVVGSIAITAAYVAAGRLDGMLSLRPCRSVDVAAAQLIVREAGGGWPSATWHPREPTSVSGRAIRSQWRQAWKGSRPSGLRKAEPARSGSDRNPARRRG